MFPSPDSSWARWRSETSDSWASVLRVMPRRLRSSRTRVPRVARNCSPESWGEFGSESLDSIGECDATLVLACSILQVRLDLSKGNEWSGNDLRR